MLWVFRLQASGRVCDAGPVKRRYAPVTRNRLTFSRWFDLDLERLRPFSPGLLALDLADPPGV